MLLVKGSFFGSALTLETSVDSSYPTLSLFQLVLHTAPQVPPNLLPSFPYSLAISPFLPLLTQHYYEKLSIQMNF